MYTENEYAPIVASYVHEHGMAVWDELFQHIEKLLPLDEDDLEPLDSDGRLRYQRIMRNLKSNRTLISLYADIIQIDGGFSTAQFANDNNIQEQTRARRVAGTTRQRRPRSTMTDNRHGEKYIRAVYKESIPSLKVFGREQVLDDIKTLTVKEFGIKYELTKTT